MQQLAETAGITLQFEPAAEPAFIEGTCSRSAGSIAPDPERDPGDRAGGLITVGTALRTDRVLVSVAGHRLRHPARPDQRDFRGLRHHQTPGLGLGLAISRKIVDQLGGQIRVSSQVGKGTTFVLEFPRTRAPARCWRQ